MYKIFGNLLLGSVLGLATSANASESRINETVNALWSNQAMTDLNLENFSPVVLYRLKASELSQEEKLERLAELSKLIRKMLAKVDRFRFIRLKLENMDSDSLDRMYEFTQSQLFRKFVGARMSILKIWGRDLADHSLSSRSSYTCNYGPNEAELKVANLVLPERNYFKEEPELRQQSLNRIGQLINANFSVLEIANLLEIYQEVSTDFSSIMDRFHDKASLESL